MLRWVRNLFLLLILVSLAYFGLRAIYRALASPQTKIRWCVEEMVEGFNAMRMRPVLAGIAKGFVDRSSGMTRDDLRSIFAWMFLHELDARGDFLWRAEFAPEPMTIELAGDKRSATVDCHVQVFHRSGESPELAWDARIAGTLSLGQDGWQWNEVTSANHAERRRR